MENFVGDLTNIMEDFESSKDQSTPEPILSSSYTLNNTTNLIDNPKEVNPVTESQQNLFNNFSLIKMRRKINQSEEQIS